MHVIWPLTSLAVVPWLPDYCASTLPICLSRLTSWLPLWGQHAISWSVPLVLFSFDSFFTDLNRLFHRSVCAFAWLSHAPSLTAHVPLPPCLCADRSEHWDHVSMRAVNSIYRWLHLSCFSQSAQFAIWLTHAIHRFYRRAISCINDCCFRCWRLPLPRSVSWLRMKQVSGGQSEMNVG